MIWGIAEFGAAGRQHFCYRLLLDSSVRPLSLDMQTQEDVEPTVRIREVKKDRVNFVLGNVDLA